MSISQFSKVQAKLPVNETLCQIHSMGFNSDFAFVSRTRDLSFGCCGCRMLHTGREC